MPVEILSLQAFKRVQNSIFMNWSVYTKEFGYNLRLAYPIILGMLGHTIVGIVDNAMVGQLGTTELAAVSLGNSFIFIAMSLGIGFSTAITPLVAEADGQRESDGGRAAFYHGLILCSIIGVFLLGSIFLAKPLLMHMGQPDEVVQLANPYLNIVAFSLLPLIIFQAYKQFADGKSATKFSMWSTLLANVVNVVINYILIFGKFGFPAMGIIGAGIGTIVSRIVMLGHIHYLVFNREQLRNVLSGFHIREYDFGIIKKITSLGFPSAMQMLFEVALFTGAIWLSGILGTESQAANQIALSLASFTFMFAMGLSVAAMIRVGNQKGLNHFVKLREVALSIFLLTVLLELLFALIFVLFHAHLPLLFLNSDPTLATENTLEVIEIASKLLLVAAVFQLVDGLQVVVLGALRGLQDVKIPMYMTFVAYWVIGFSVSIWLGIYTSLGAVGIWLGLCAGLTAAAVMLYARFEYITRKLLISS